ncbi:Smr/MutS family protein, partial [Chloroflexota bacterium]
TFSSHLTNIVQILDRASSRSLLLFDELGAGTDPVEGSALARAVLSHLLARRFTTLVATHYSELKTFAHTTLGVENASVEFNVETLSPTYRLSVGLPGRSNAFAIAQRLGLSSEIVEEARAMVSPEELATESLLAEIQQAHQEAVRARDEAFFAQRQIEEQQHRVAIHLAAIEAERAAILGEARTEARRELAEIRVEIESIQAELTGRRSETTLGEEWLAQARARLAEQEKTMSLPLPQAPLHETSLPGVLSIGDSVWVEGLGTTGEVMALDGDSAEVQVGSFHVRVQQNALERRASPRPMKQERTTPLAISHPSPGIELDLRGQRVQEILPRVDKYLDDAFLAGLAFVRLIHGKGTGALREAVRQQLREHPLVESHRLGEQGEGGSGVTVAYLTKS